MTVFWRTWYPALFFLLGGLTCADPGFCPVQDSIFALPKDVCSVGARVHFSPFTGVIEELPSDLSMLYDKHKLGSYFTFYDLHHLYLHHHISFLSISLSPKNTRPHLAVLGDEVSLQKALHMVHKNEHDYVALLFYSSWCPFSGSFRPIFSVLSSIFPSIPHFAIEESAVRPSILSKYGVHGFPSLILLNSTIRIRYQGSRTLESLISFYGDATGTEAEPSDKTYLDKIGCSRQDEKDKTNQETCPFPWARSPENLLQQETYLALATIFVILRLLYFTFPTLRKYAQLVWRRYIINASFSSLWEHPVFHLNRVIQLFNSLKEPCKKSNLQEGAKNAKAWASKSLATVSFGDSSSSRDASISCVH